MNHWINNNDLCVIDSIIFTHSDLVSDGYSILLLASQLTLIIAISQSYCHTVYLVRVYQYVCSSNNDGDDVDSNGQDEDDSDTTTISATILRIYQRVAAAQQHYTPPQQAAVVEAEGNSIGNNNNNTTVSSSSFSVINKAEQEEQGVGGAKQCLWIVMTILFAFCLLAIVCFVL